MLFLAWGFALFWASCSKQKDERPPNILLILADDMGYSDLSCFGGEIPTPHLDRLAEGGLRMTQFYNAARCCPTRASLLTGLYPHQAGMGDMVEGRLGPDSSFLPAYQGFLAEHALTLAEVLGEAGYHTMMSGKWHVGDEPEHWPHARGFQDNYTLIQGAANYFTLEPWFSKDQEILLLDGRDTVLPGKDFYLTREINHAALRFLGQRPRNKPFFLYLAHTAPHWPLQALPEDVEMFQRRYLPGWDEIRASRHAKMLDLGILEAPCSLSPPYQWKDLTPDWESLSDEEKEVWDLRMAVYAAMIYRMDQGIGAIIDFLEKEGELDNTLIMFLSDNGATSAAIYLVEAWNVDRSGPIGSARSFEAQGPSWANVSNTPLRLFKKHTTEGGIRTPFIAHWPKAIAPGRISREAAHVIDLMPTLVDISGAIYPDQKAGRDILSMEGKSLEGIFSGSDTLAPRPLFFEHAGNRALQQGKWKIEYQNSPRENPEGTWKLYNLDEDPTELTDLSKEFPEVLHGLMEQYEAWALSVGVEEDYHRLILARPL